MLYYAGVISLPESEDLLRGRRLAESRLLMSGCGGVVCQRVDEECVYLVPACRCTRRARRSRAARRWWTCGATRTASSCTRCATGVTWVPHYLEVLRVATGLVCRSTRPCVCAWQEGTPSCRPVSNIGDSCVLLRDRLGLLQEQGVVFPRDSWPEKLLRAHPRCPCDRPPETLIP